MATQNIFNLTDTWNAGGTTFTAVGMNVTDTASAAGSALMDLQVGGVSQFKVSKAGAVTAVGVAIPTISSTDTLSNKTLSSPTLSGTVSGSVTLSGNNVHTGVNRFTRSDGAVYFDGTTHGDTIAFYQDTNGEYIIECFETATPANKLAINFAKYGGSVLIGGDAIPTVSSANTLTNKTLTRPVFTSTTVAGLTAAATAGLGARAFVTDALAPVFGNAVVGSGAVAVPVYSTGAAWNVG